MFSPNQHFELVSCEENMGMKNQPDTLITGAFSGRSVSGQNIHGNEECGT